MRHEIPEHIVCRPGTVDRDIWREAVEMNTYRLPADVFSPGDNVLNIGAHTGSVAWRCAISGANVVCVEPSRENYHLLMHNLRPVWDRVMPIHAAAWRSDQPATTVQYEPNWAPINTGGGGVMGDKGGAGYEVLAIPLADLIQLRKKWRLMVIDCEGAEFPALLTTFGLDRIESIAGEYHERGKVRTHADVGQPFTMETLAKHLASQGFRVEVDAKGVGMGLFWATKK